MERFFLFCSQFDEINLVELLLRRYGKDVFELDLTIFYDFCRFAVEKEQNEELREEYNALYPWMALKYLKYMPFKEYCDKRTGKNIDFRPASEIIAEIEELHRNAEGGE